MHADTELIESTNIYVNQRMKNLPSSVTYMENLHQHLRTNNICSTVMQMYMDGLNSMHIQEC